MTRPFLLSLFVALALAGCWADLDDNADEKSRAELPDEHERISTMMRKRALRMTIEAELREREAADTGGERGRQLRVEAREARQRADEAATEASLYTGWTVQRFREEARVAADRAMRNPEDRPKPSTS